MRNLVVLTLLLLTFTSTAEARGWRLFGRRARCSSGNCYSSSPVQGSIQKGGPAQKVAEYKVSVMASQNRRGHYFHGAPYGNGFGAEGVGSGNSPQAALNSCCTFNRPLVASATAQSASGRWFGIKLYR